MTAAVVDKQPVVDMRVLARNVLANWGGHCVTLAAGFILPRLINDHIGQVRLGLWDFAWSIAGSFFILTGGIGSAVNRYVARHRAVADWTSLNRTVSACMGLYLLCTAGAMALATAASWWIYVLFPAALETGLWEARIVVFLLGISMAAQLPVATYHGVITGHQRYDLATWIETGCRIVSVAAMIGALFLGFGLIALCVLTALREGCVGLLKYLTAHRICPTLRLSLRGIRRGDIRCVLAFGGKTYMNFVADIAAYQLNRVALGAYLGPVALAMFARPLGLVNACQQLIYHFGRVLTPVASDLQASQGDHKLAELLLSATRYSVLLALPMAAFLVVFGDGLLTLWMGEGYRVGHLLTVLAVGHLATFMQIGPYHILLGMNRHGTAALATLIAACISLIINIAGLGFGQFGLEGAAFSIVLPLSIAHGIVVPICAARAVGMPLRKYAATTARAAFMVAPFVVVIGVMRMGFGGAGMLAISAAALAGGLTHAATLLVAHEWPLGERRAAVALQEQAYSVTEPALNAALSAEA